MCSCSVETSVRGSKKIPRYQLRSTQTTTRHVSEERTDQEPPTNTKRKEISQYRKDWNSIRASKGGASMLARPRQCDRKIERQVASGDAEGTKGARAWSRVQWVWMVLDNQQSAPKGSARDGISVGLRGTPERYRLMMPGGRTGAGNARYLSGFRSGRRKHYSASWREVGRV